jgi:hypothetical protein
MKTLPVVPAGFFLHLRKITYLCKKRYDYGNNHKKNNEKNRQKQSGETEETVDIRGVEEKTPERNW